jgi:putative tryptophan/tyrosine transport system substrate-binding protein
MMPAMEAKRTVGRRSRHRRTDPFQKAHLNGYDGSFWPAGTSMRRRQFITLLGGAAAAWPLAARAQQQERMRRVGVLMSGPATDALRQSYLAAFVLGLRQLGWTEGQNLRIDVRWNAADAELARIYGAQLIGLMPDVILSVSTPNLTVIQQATSTVPIVFLQVSDPVAQGFVANVAHPGGNLTGFSDNEFSIGGKWVGLLKEAAPGLARVAIMFNPDTSPQSQFYMRAIEAAAPSLGVQAIAVPIRAAADIEPALVSFSRQPNGGLILPTDTFTNNSLRYKLIADLATRNHLPSISALFDFPKNGGLMHYGSPDDYLVDQFRQAATYVDRILKGAKPGDLPVQLRDKYTLGINLKTAKALGLTLPSGLLAIADQVIE